MRIVGAMCALALLLAFTTTAQASSTLSAVAATAAHNCGKYAALTHRGQEKRALASAKRTKLHRYAQAAYRSCTTIVFIRNHPKVAALKVDKWWHVKGPAKHRLSVRRVRAKAWRILNKDLPWLDSRIEALTPEPRPVIPAFLQDAFLCIHHYEGAWNANTGNGYYGGLQMDVGFQSRYGSEFVRKWGTADNWPVWAQLAAAVRAYQSGRGFYPWPNTARVCGLI
jgi:hypothetical protein